MDRHAETYFRALRGASQKRAASPGVFGDLSWGDSLAKAVPDAAASHGLGQSLTGAGQGLRNFGTGAINWLGRQARDATYGPIPDAYQHSTQGTNYVLQGDYGNAARSYANAGIDTLSAGINGALLLGAPFSGGADEIPGQAAKKGLIYGLKHLVDGVAAPLVGGAARPGVAAATRTLAQPVFGAAERLGAGGLTNLVRAAGSAANGWLDRSAQSTASQLFNGSILNHIVPSGAGSLPGRIASYGMSHFVAPVLHAGASMLPGVAEGKLEQQIGQADVRKFFGSMSPEQLQGYLSQNYGAENLQKNMATLRSRGLL